MEEGVHTGLLLSRNRLDPLLPLNSIFFIRLNQIILKMPSIEQTVNRVSGNMRGGDYPDDY